jgi:molybdopterin biosynthesis enzyme MoaB
MHFALILVGQLTHPVTADDQVKAYIKKIMSQLKEWMYGGKISKLVVVITSKETGEHVERWQFDVRWGSSTNVLLLTGGTGPNIREERKNEDIEESDGQRKLCPRVRSPLLLW